jgi:tetratricopeptide (TPR) repeat protein
LTCFATALPAFSMDYPRAAMAYRQVLAVVPNDVFARVNLGHCLVATGDLRGGLAEIAKVSRNPQFSTAVTADYSKVLLTQMAESPVGPVMMPGSAHYRLGTELLLCGQARAAAYEFTLAVAAESPEPQGYRELGNLLADSNEFGLAYIAYQRYVALAPNALDRSTIAVRIALLKNRHGEQMMEQLATAKAEIASATF